MSEKKAQQAAAGKTAEQKATMERNVLFQTTQMPL
jgi:hypothetical protein